VISPYVRRMRLAAELLRLRTDHHMTAHELAAKVGVKRQSISRLENSRVVPDLDLIMRILDHLGVGEGHWNDLMTIAREAAERGWWEKFANAMGSRQALYANFEAGACAISEYQLAFLPGLLQIPSFTEARIQADKAVYGWPFDAARALEARQARQRVVERPGGPHYEVIIDELAIRRPAASAEVTRAQLDHLVGMAHHRTQVRIRVLPLTAMIPGRAIPRSAFSTYRYPDPGDPIVVAVDTVTSDLVLTDPDDVGPYLTLYQRLADVALSPTESLDYLAKVAEELPSR
jgi:DNA-binding XRE family transcriptional regulator